MNANTWSYYTKIGNWLVCLRLPLKSLIVLLLQPVHAHYTQKMTTYISVYYQRNSSLRISKWLQVILMQLLTTNEIIGLTITSLLFDQHQDWFFFTFCKISWFKSVIWINLPDFSPKNCNCDYYSYNHDFITMTYIKQPCQQHNILTFYVFISIVIFLRPVSIPCSDLTFDLLIWASFCRDGWSRFSMLRSSCAHCLPWVTMTVKSRRAVFVHLKSFGWFRNSITIPKCTLTNRRTTWRATTPYLLWFSANRSNAMVMILNVHTIWTRKARIQQIIPLVEILINKQKLW